MDWDQLSQLLGQPAVCAAENNSALCGALGSAGRWEGPASSAAFKSTRGLDLRLALTAHTTRNF